MTAQSALQQQQQLFAVAQERRNADAFAILLVDVVFGAMPCIVSAGLASSDGQAISGHLFVVLHAIVRSGAQPTSLFRLCLQPFFVFAAQRSSVACTQCRRGMMRCADATQGDGWRRR